MSAETIMADKLRAIANYITESDHIIAQLLDDHGVTFKRANEDVSAGWSELVSGREMQEDLRAWADSLDPRSKHD